MITEEKIKEIHKNLRSGLPEGEIRESLISEGYSKEDIDKAFAPHRYDMRSWYLVFAFVLMLFGLWLLLKNGNLVGLGFSALLFVQYYRETERLKREKTH